ncbi:MAG TPA: pyridoxamine 5'-phosphate oxidase family protein [Kiritimatiellia bacterium]|nr:pyridoxamine 5'-phosphate oxidase family protein [Kiritimatiellia bacterium]HRZ12377.1 pyridoxamine 5'-phosphate oxidase family protein [Kiritimatiellia bacterium]HSA17865.1 pyridoxamine 5'-phosphate oxidase family protein [Kiritimatiellia bacterium]
MKALIALLAVALLALPVAAEEPVDGVSGASWTEPSLPPLSDEELTQKITNWLAGHWMLTLATADRRGEPHASPVVYFSEGTTIYVRAKPDTNKIRNIEQNPSVAYTVWEPAAKFEQVRSLQVSGRARVLRGAERDRVERIFRTAPGTQAAAIRAFLEKEGISPEQAFPEGEAWTIVAIEPIQARWIERSRSADEGQVWRTRPNR